MKAGIEADFPCPWCRPPARAGTERRWHGMLVWMGIKKRWWAAKAEQARAAAAWIGLRDARGGSSEKATL